MTDPHDASETAADAPMTDTDTDADAATDAATVMADRLNIAVDDLTDTVFSRIEDSLRQYDSTTGATFCVQQLFITGEYGREDYDPDVASDLLVTAEVGVTDNPDDVDARALIAELIGPLHDHVAAAITPVLFNHRCVVFNSPANNIAFRPAPDLLTDVDADLRSATESAALACGLHQYEPLDQPLVEKTATIYDVRQSTFRPISEFIPDIEPKLAANRTHQPLNTL